MLPIIVIHGGAGTIPDERRKIADDGVRAAISDGWEILKDGGSALDAVQAAVRSMESNPAFNAGYGSVITLDKKVEMDALLMDGKGLRVGGVIGVSRVKHPIDLCRIIMDNSKHVLFTGEGAEKIAKDNGIELIDPSELITERVLQRYDRFLEQQKHMDMDPEGRDKYGTVGAIALDSTGNLAAATSTGGTLGKISGRVGDTPIVGAGTYADDEIAISATGVGEYIIRGMLGFRVKYEYLKTPDIHNATNNALKYVTKEVGPAGIITLDNKGNWSALKTTKDLVYAVKTESELHTFLDD